MILSIITDVLQGRVEKMRREATINSNWCFTREQISGMPESVAGWERVDLPHTWNSYDGQDGGADYFRGQCFYLKDINIPSVVSGRMYYIEFGAVASECTVYINGSEAARHSGGYSLFRADITPYITAGKNTVLVRVSNESRSDIYPQMADFTFFGGIHRSVRLIEVERTHFDMDCYGSRGVCVYSDVHDGEAVLYLKGYVCNAEKGDSVRFILKDADGQGVAEAFCDASDANCSISLGSVHLWQGTKDPYLYTVTAQVIRKNDVIDSICMTHGFRSFYIDPQKGFYLNGVLTPLRGVSRHGDRYCKGLALSLEDHIKDAELIREVGANTVRLAHYQHDEEFYALCDRYGFIVWAEIPFISRMSPDPKAHEGCMRQMRELIYQCFNHTCICFWGISNEITIGGSTEGLLKNLNSLNDLAHSLDSTRVTTMAQVTMLPMEDEQNSLTDILAYNHYFGWYLGSLSDNEAWLDEFHKKYPERALGLSEYGCEAIISYHSAEPRMGDYTEEYQCLYHEHMLRVLEERPWIWGSYVWNMFDFACDSRDEGGVAGRNNKGLVSYDRAIKKDSFYACKSYWSDEPFVHICSRRYYERAEEKIDVKVYSSCDSVSLTVNGESMGKLGGKHVFIFRGVSLKMGENTLTAHSGRQSDCVIIRRVSCESDGFVCADVSVGEVSNWFEGRSAGTAESMTFREGFYSVRSTVRQILGSERAGDMLAAALASATRMNVKKNMLMMMADQTPEQLITAMKPKDIDADEVLKMINFELQSIPIEQER